jgi:hypothetical protein
MRQGLLAWVSGAVVVALVLCVGVGAKTKTTIKHDKAFDFAGKTTWAWHPDGSGSFKLLQATGEDPDKLYARFDPVISGAVEQALAARGLTRTAGAPDFYVNYYVLIGPGNSTQYAGQFLAPTPEWGVIPFVGATTSFEVFEQGSLILDVSAVSTKSVVWRGVAQAEIDRQRSAEARDQRLRDAVSELLKKFPPKK